jgi:hypothetical protein
MEGIKVEKGLHVNGSNESGRRVPNRGESLPPEVQPPVSIGVHELSPLPAVRGDYRRLRTAPPPEHALAKTTPGGRPSNLERTVGVLRAAIPFVQRILPLLDGNIGTAVSNVLAPHQHMPPPPPPLNLEPIEDDLAALHEQYRDLRNRILEQHASLKRVEDQLEKVRETAETTAFEQQGFVDDLKAVRKKANWFALIALAILAVSVTLNVVLYLHIVHLLP